MAPIPRITRRRTASRAFETRSERIVVKNQPDVNLMVRTTRHGPVISDVSASAGAATPKGYALAFQWTALQDDDMTVEAGPMIALAGNWKEFLEGVKRFHSPQQNIVYADVDGNIGFIAAGRVRSRARQRPDGNGPGTRLGGALRLAGLHSVRGTAAGIQPGVGVAAFGQRKKLSPTITSISSAATGPCLTAPIALPNC